MTYKNENLLDWTRECVADLTTHRTHDLTTITFDRSVLYDNTKGAFEKEPFADNSLRCLLGIISQTIGKADRHETLLALREYGIAVHDHYQSADGTNMFGPIPDADTELPE